MRMRRLVQAAIAAATAGLLTAGPAAATTVHWNETATVNHVKVMGYRVDSLTVGKGSWTASVSFTNESSATLKVGTQFGLAFYADKSAEALSKEVGFAHVTEVSSQIPTSLGPGASWSGTIGGTGKLTIRNTLYTRVVFGPFTGLPGEKNPVVWITNHELTLVPAGNVA